MRKEKDPASKERLKSLDGEIGTEKNKFHGLESQWKREKEVINELRAANPELERSRIALERAEREADLNKAAEIKYGKIPELEKKIKAANAKLQALTKDRTALLREEVIEEDVAKVVARWTGIPVARLIESEGAKLTHMEEEIHKRMIDQNEAVKAVADAIRRHRAGISAETKPIGSFIFLGPTSVGKTELARSLAEFLFNDEGALVRIDMSEYMEQHTVARLIGAPPGYVGYEEGGQLTEAVRRRPYSVILFDEIEKAHSDVFNLLLQVLDDGRLTDGRGRTVDFNSTVIIMTSNLGSEIIQKYEGKTPSIMQEELMTLVRQTFRPEFLNRIDEIVFFNTLGEKEIAQITKEGFDPLFGARPLKRVIQDRVLDELASWIVEGKVNSGDTITGRLEQDKILFSK